MTTKTPTAADLTAVVATFNALTDLHDAGYEHGTKDTIRIGDTAVIYSRGTYRQGIVTKIGRVNATVAYTTAGAIREAADFNLNHRTTEIRHFQRVANDPQFTDDQRERYAAHAARLEAGPLDPKVTNKADKFEAILIRRTATPAPVVTAEVEEVEENPADTDPTGDDVAAEIRKIEGILADHPYMDDSTRACLHARLAYLRDEPTTTPDATPTPAQREYLLAGINRTDRWNAGYVHAPTGPTRRVFAACLAAGWITADGQVTDKGRAAVGRTDAEPTTAPAEAAPVTVSAYELRRDRGQHIGATVRFAKASPYGHGNGDIYQGVLTEARVVLNTGTGPAFTAVWIAGVDGAIWTTDDTRIAIVSPPAPSACGHTGGSPMSCPRGCGVDMAEHRSSDLVEGGCDTPANPAATPCTADTFTTAHQFEADPVTADADGYDDRERCGLRASHPIHADHAPCTAEEWAFPHAFDATPQADVPAGHYGRERCWGLRSDAIHAAHSTPADLCPRCGGDLRDHNSDRLIDGRCDTGADNPPDDVDPTPALLPARPDDSDLVCVGPVIGVERGPHGAVYTATH